MFLNQRLLLPLLLHIILVSFASEKAPRSRLQLFPDKDFEFVPLGHLYHAMSEEEKSKSLYLQEGCYTILDNTQEDACVLVGPLHPSQLLSLCINDKTIVAHILANSNFIELLTKIKGIFPGYDSSKITGELFTNNAPLYSHSIMDIQKMDSEKVFCLQKIYQNRTQMEELLLNKNLILEAFKIQNREQIKARKFISSKKDFELGDYELAELYVFIKIINNKPAIFNTCPMAEKYFGNFAGLPIEDRCNITLQNQNRRPNPFYLNKPENISFSYGAMPFCYIPITSDN